MQSLLIAIFIWIACLADMGWAVWTELPVAPAFLDLSLVAAVLFAKPRGAVFWSGLIGMIVCVNQQSTPGAAISLYVSVGFVAAVSKPLEHKRASMTSVAFRSLMILMVLRIGNLWIANFPSADFLAMLTVEHLAQVAFSFLLSVLICLLFVVLRHRSAWA